jgi:alpha-galactosidase
MILIEENGLFLAFEVTDTQDFRLLHFSPLSFCEDRLDDEIKRKWFRMVEIQATGQDIDDHHGAKHTGTMPGMRLKYREFRDTRNETGRKLEIEQTDQNLVVISHLQFFDGIPVVRSWTEVKNTGTEPIGLEYVSSFALTGIDKEGSGTWDAKSILHVPHNTWCGEMQWCKYRLPELGLSKVKEFNLKRLSYSSSGTWPCKEFLPMGCYENTESGSFLFWQIETNGSWQWEIGDTQAGRLYLRLSGPTEAENHWWKNLAPGESLVSESVAVGTVQGDLDRVFGELTRYRRRIVRPHPDHRDLPIIFNDYMHCLFADPTTEKEIPLINIAAEAGCEIFCIDAGWYGEGNWWDTVGEWQPAEKRFPGGLIPLLDRIRTKGLVPGLWLELEVMGVNCPLAKELPDECFFMRHGKRVIDHGRYQLDFRHPLAIRHANAVIDRLVREYGIGYIKMDYNIDAGIGTQVRADSFGDGLLQHTHAYLNWLDGVFGRYPNLVIESCSSGGLRTNYALLSRHTIESITDQTDYRKLAVIAAASPTGLLPEQSAVWSCPLANSSREEVVFNMVSALLLRIHQAGRIDLISPENLALVKEANAYYKKIRPDLTRSLPFWPLGLPSFESEWMSLGLRGPNTDRLAIWRMNSARETCELSVPHRKENKCTVRCAYPTNTSTTVNWNSERGILSVTMPTPYSAGIIEFLKP